MLRNRAMAMATALMTAVSFTAFTGASQAYEIRGLAWAQETVYALGPSDNYVAEWMGPTSGWIIIGGPASHIYAGSAGVFATNPSTGDIWEYNGTPNSWTEIGGPGQKFAEGGGHLYGLGPNGSYVAEWNGPGLGWTVIGGPADSIWAGSDGLIAVAPSGTDTPGDIWRYNGTPNNWTDIGAGGSKMAVGNAAIYRIDTNEDIVDEWTGGTTWTQILADDDRVPVVLDIIAGDQGVYVTDNDRTLKYNGTPNNWSVISNTSGATLVPEAESQTSLYAAVRNSLNETANIIQYSGSGTTWNVIGGPAGWGLAADGGSFGSW